MADRSASVGFSLWNEQAAAIEGGDILKLTKGLIWGEGGCNMVGGAKGFTWALIFGML